MKNTKNKAKAKNGQKREKYLFLSQQQATLPKQQQDQESLCESMNRFINL